MLCYSGPNKFMNISTVQFIDFGRVQVSKPGRSDENVACLNNMTMTIEALQVRIPVNTVTTYQLSESCSRTFAKSLRS